MTEKKQLSNLEKEAAALAAVLRKKNIKLVLAESCTAGLISASLARIPQISQNYCGSAVVYRNDTKNKWLNISASTIRKHSPVSREVAYAMATSVLRITPEADLSAAITGYLGPRGPTQQLGRIFIAVALRGSEHVWIQEKFLLRSARHNPKLRHQRQVLASHEVLFMVRSLLRLLPKDVHF